ncbi:three component ABC system middle component [Maribellus maritimus]|uniref:three component ABC system middle component n=1 Tax=Maribellus maritimus TaxID=2870838 RepID=UPI001EEA224C|nr:three component ABC system middle component [Maribellus maritimus]MCG6189980.1 DUF6521 family protein [Maribellus maritimus]
MSKFTDNIFTIHNNIFSLTPVIIAFYKNYKSREKDIFLAYFILPIVLDPIVLDEIKSITTKSNLTRLVSNKKVMAGFHDRFKQFYQITNDCLQYALDCKYIEINETNLSVKVVNRDVLYTDSSLNKAINIASKLPKMFKLDVINTYYAFGIKGL